jgi:hypothetical protein
MGFTRSVGIDCIFISFVMATLCFSEPFARAESQSEDETGRARALFEQGVELADRGEWEHAAERFRQSLALRPSGGVRLNLASSLAQLGRHAEAARHLEDIVGDSGAPPRVIELARGLLADVEQHTGRVQVGVEGDTGGAQVALDGEVQDMGRAATGVRVDPGVHEVVLTLDGREVDRREVDVVAGATVEVRLQVPTRVAQEPQGTLDGVTPPEDGVTPSPPDTVDAVAVPPGEDDGEGTSPPEGGEGATEPAGEGRNRPLSRDWRLWLGVGSAVAVIAVVVGLSVGLSGEPEDPIEGNMEPGVWSW